GERGRHRYRRVQLGRPAGAPAQRRRARKMDRFSPARPQVQSLGNRGEGDARDRTRQADAGRQSGGQLPLFERPARPLRPRRRDFDPEDLDPVALRNRPGGQGRAAGPLPDNRRTPVLIPLRIVSRFLLAGLFVAVLAPAGCRRKAAVFRKAPVIIISVDTLRADHLPLYSYRSVETPAIDALARDGIVYDNAVSHVPLTLPSHVSLFTGLLPFQSSVHFYMRCWRHRVTDHAD